MIERGGPEHVLLVLAAALAAVPVATAAWWCLRAFARRIRDPRPPEA